MELTPCNGCGKMLSPMASVCPNCGHPQAGLVRQSASGIQTALLIWAIVCTICAGTPLVGLTVFRPDGPEAAGLMHFLWIAVSLALVVGWTPYLLYWLGNMRNNGMSK